MRVLTSTAEPTSPPGTENVPDSVREGAEGAVDSLGPFWGVLSTVAIAVAIAVGVVLLGSVLVSVALHRRPRLGDQIARCRMPVLAVAVFVAARIGLGLTASDVSWYTGLNFVLVAGIISSLGWLVLRVVRIVEERVLDKYAAEGVEDRRDRKIRTQTVLLRRVIQVAVIVIVVSVILLTIPQVRAVGAGLLASAGVISVVAGLAVQSTLTNVFAGIQLVFTDAIRVGDVVIADEVYGTVEDITLSYVVVKVWDGRRVIYPSSHFTTTAFENWTRTGSALSGTVEIEVDWRAPVNAVRDRLKALLKSTELWDGKDGSIQVSEAMSGTMTLRVAVSARNAGDLWDLRCLVREDLVTYLRTEHPESIYAQRFAESPALSPEHPVQTEEPEAPEHGQPKDRKHDAGPAGSAASATPGAGSVRPPRTPTSPLPRVDPSDGKSTTGTTDTTDRKGATDETGTTDASDTTDRQRQAADTGAVDAVTGSTPLTRSSEDSSMFTGSISAVERNREFAGPGEAAYAARKERAERDAAADAPVDGEPADADRADHADRERAPEEDLSGR